jgi:hypothetical protein
MVRYCAIEPVALRAHRRKSELNSRIKVFQIFASMVRDGTPTTSSRTPSCNHTVVAERTKMVKRVLGIGLRPWPQFPVPRSARHSGYWPVILRMLIKAKLYMGSLPFGFASIIVGLAESGESVT